MIALDSSAIVAIALNESEAEDFLSFIESDEDPCLSAANYFEASLVLEGRLGAPGRAMFEAVILTLTEMGLRVVKVDRQTAELARDAFRRFGKGKHPAKLNFGDCFAYALAKGLDVPLLYKGADFDKTDLTPTL